MSESIFENKQFLLLIIGWFVFSFLVLWFIGGACLNPLNGSSCIASGSLSFLSKLPLIGLLFPFDQWSSLMYFFAPIAGFVLAFGIIKWWNEYFETKEASGIMFLVLILLVLFLGYYVNLFFYMNEGAAGATARSGGQAVYSLYFCITQTTDSDCQSTVQKLNNEFITQAQNAKANTVQQYVAISYWSELRRSMFLLFILGAIAAWVPLFGRDLFEKYKSQQ